MLRKIILAATAVTLLAGTATFANSNGLVIAAAQAWAQSLTGDGFSLADGPDSPYYRGEIAPPSWQGRPYAIRSHDDPTF